MLPLKRSTTNKIETFWISFWVKNEQHVYFYHTNCTSAYNNSWLSSTRQYFNLVLDPMLPNKHGCLCCNAQSWHPQQPLSCMWNKTSVVNFLLWLLLLMMYFFVGWSFATDDDLHQIFFLVIIPMLYSIHIILLKIYFGVFHFHVSTFNLFICLRSRQTL